MIIIRTRQISPSVITRPKRLTLIIEYEYGEQMPQWYQYCQQQSIAYMAYKTVLPSFIPPGNNEFMFSTNKSSALNMHLDETSIESIEIKSNSILKDEPSILPTIILARPLVDNFKLLRTLECR